MESHGAIFFGYAYTGHYVLVNHQWNESYAGHVDILQQVEKTTQACWQIPSLCKHQELRLLIQKKEKYGQSSIVFLLIYPS